MISVCSLGVLSEFITANENDSFVYISKARKQLTELEALWVVASSDARIFNKLRPITVL